MAPHTDETRFRGVAAITLDSGELAATFLPDVGHDRRVAARRWARAPRPAWRRRTPAGGRHGRPAAARPVGEPARRPPLPRGRACPSTCAGSRSATDGRGLPIHGFLAGAPGWRVDRADRAPRSAPASGPRSTSTIRRSRSRTASTSRSPQPGRSWPSPRPSRPTGDRRVPIAFGWHPYLRLTGVPRRQWLLRLPARRHLALDGSGIPTGDEAGEPAEAAPIGRRTFDDLYALGSDRSARAPDRPTAGRSSCATTPPTRTPRSGCPPASRTPRSSRWPRRRTRSWPARRRLVEPGESRTARFALRIS